jgi:SAM-dependent methyltransferase
VQSLREVYVRQAFSDDVSEHWSGPPQMVERIASVLRTDPSHRVLDVGCGLGGPARRLGRTVRCHIVGVDVVEEVVRAAAARPGPLVRYVVGEGARLPVRSESFDQIWCLGTLAHLATTGELATECARVLVSGGRAAITEAFWGGRGEPRFGRSAPQPWRAVTIDETTASLQAAGLVDVRILPWPGDGIAAPRPSDPALAADLADQRLIARLVVARRR